MIWNVLKMPPDMGANFVYLTVMYLHIAILTCRNHKELDALDVKMLQNHAILFDMEKCSICSLRKVYEIAHLYLVLGQSIT